MLGVADSQGSSLRVQPGRVAHGAVSRAHRMGLRAHHCTGGVDALSDSKRIAIIKPFRTPKRTHPVVGASRHPTIVTACYEQLVAGTCLRECSTKWPGSSGGRAQP